MEKNLEKVNDILEILNDLDEAFQDECEDKNKKFAENRLICLGHISSIEGAVEALLSSIAWGNTFKEE